MLISAVMAELCMKPHEYSYNELKEADLIHMEIYLHAAITLSLSRDL